MGWVGASALAMGGSNQSLFLLSALIIGQGSIRGQGSAAVPLLVIGLLLGWMALPGWTELVLMRPGSVGGIAATCGEAFRPYAPVLGNLVGTSYWWGWVPTCGLTALLSASAIHQWFLPTVQVPLLASGLVLFFTAVNLTGVRWASRLAVPIATASAVLAFLSCIIPVAAGTVDWHLAATFHLDTPFEGRFGKVTSAMAGLYLVGFAAPAFEAAACHVGEMRDPEKNAPRAMYASAAMATVYFLVLPVIWLGTIGEKGLAGDLAVTLGPTFAPLFGATAKSFAIWFMMFNMFHGTLAPLTGAARTLSQLAEDGFLPELFARRNRWDCPWVAITVTAAFAIGFLLIGDPVWLVAAANFTYLIGISLPSVAVWLLRKDQPDHPRPYRAPRGTIVLGLIAALVWGLSTVLGFQQFGLPTVLLGLAMAYSGAALYAFRKLSDRRKAGHRGLPGSLHVKLTGAMLLVLMLDGAGYIMAVRSVDVGQTALVTVLEDIFVAVAILTITVGLVLPGMIAHSAVEVSKAANRLATGTLADFSRAMGALARGDLDAAHARVDVQPILVTTRDEVGDMARSFNHLQDEVVRAAVGLDGARDGLRAARDEVAKSRLQLAAKERLEREMEIGKSIQTSILPPAFAVDGLEISARMIPASEVGGDYYDGFPVPGGGWLGIGDVAGHGLPAGLIMLMVQSTVAALCRAAPDAAPREIVRVVSEVLYDNIRHRLCKDEYVTMTILRYFRDGRFVFAGAHEDIIVFRKATGACELVVTPGTWAGAKRDVTSVTVDSQLVLEDGDVMILYTDGITEAMNPAMEPFGIERICALVQREPTSPVEELRDAILAAASAWSADAPGDDLTVVAVRYRGKPGPKTSLFASLAQPEQP